MLNQSPMSVFSLLSTLFQKALWHSSTLSYPVMIYLCQSHFQLDFLEEATFGCISKAVTISDMESRSYLFLSVSDVTPYLFQSAEQCVTVQ